MARGRLMAMPILVANMGGEMIYILEQRLRAQSISAAKATKGEPRDGSRRQCRPHAQPRIRSACAGVRRPARPERPARLGARCHNA